MHDQVEDIGSSKGGAAVLRFDELGEAVEEARTWAAEGERRAVVVTGSIVLVGEAMALAATRRWRAAE